MTTFSKSFARKRAPFPPKNNEIKKIERELEAAKQDTEYETRCQAKISFPEAFDMEKQTRRAETITHEDV